jgi:hypothetical protein
VGEGSGQRTVSRGTGAVASACAIHTSPCLGTRHVEGQQLQLTAADMQALGKGVKW